MTSTIQPDDLEDLLAAHALGALDGHELEIVEHALATDRNARSEHARFTRATQLLDSSSGPRPEVWDNIAKAIDTNATDRTRVRRGVVTPFGSARRPGVLGARRVVRTIGIAAAVGVVIAATAWGVDQVAQPSSPTPRSSVQRAARSAAKTHGARRVVLTTATGKSASLVLLPNGLGYVLSGNLPTAVPGSAYRLLGVTDHGNVELATIGRQIKPTAFRLPQHVTGLVLEQGSAATGQQIASRVVGVPGAGSQSAHTPNPAGGSSPVPTTPPSPTVKIPTPPETVPALPGLLHP